MAFSRLSTRGRLLPTWVRISLWGGAVGNSKMPFRSRTPCSRTLRVRVRVSSFFLRSIKAPVLRRPKGMGPGEAVPSLTTASLRGGAAPSLPSPTRPEGKPAHDGILVRRHIVSVFEGGQTHVTAGGKKMVHGTSKSNVPHRANQCQFFGRGTGGHRLYGPKGTVSPVRTAARWRPLRGARGKSRSTICLTGPLLLS